MVDDSRGSASGGGYRHPGVYVTETSDFGPHSIEGVRTDVPAFVGYTEKSDEGGAGSGPEISLRWVSSLLEFEGAFGGPVAEKMTVGITPGPTPSVSFVTSPPDVPRFLLHYAVRLFFSNGGRACWVVSVGRYGPDGAGAEVQEAELKSGLRALKDCHEPALVAVPDATALNLDAFGRVVDEALKVSSAFPRRFAILDVPGAVPDGTMDDDEVTRGFRDRIGASSAELRNGAAYFPYLRTRVPLHWTDRSVTVQFDDRKSVPLRGPRARSAGRGYTLEQLRRKNVSAYSAVRQFLASTQSVLPPSGAVAGAFAQVDRTRGVWHAAANVPLQDVVEPAFAVSTALNERLNAHTSGVSVNVIRTFPGKGTLIWGARTLAAEDPESRYVPVRRLLNFIETSAHMGIESFAFEPNDPNTWNAVRAEVEGFLMRLWRSGALLGVKADEAFFVRVGLGQTMTASDVTAGRLKLQIGVAAMRPAEFLVLALEKEVGR